MLFSIKATKIELTDAIRDAVAKRLEGLEKKIVRFGESVRAEAEVSRTTRHHKKGEVFRAEIQISLPGKKVYAEATHEDLYAAIGDAKREAERQVIAYKEIAVAKSRLAADKLKAKKAADKEKAVKLAEKAKAKKLVEKAKAEKAKLAAKKPRTSGFERNPAARPGRR